MATEVVVPPLGQTVDAVTLVAWYKDEGQAVAQGETLFAIETDKATLDIEAPASGVLRQVTAQPGDEVQVLSGIATIAASDEEVAEVQPAKPRPAAAVRSAAVPTVQQASTPRDRIFISPRARRLAEQHGIPLQAFAPTGPEGAIVERDVHAYLAAQADIATVAPALSPASRAAEAPARDPIRSTLSAEVDATELAEMRDRLARGGPDVTYGTLMLAALGRVLQEFPQLAPPHVDRQDVTHQRVHVAVAAVSERGLLLPVVRDVDRKGLRLLEDEVCALSERAQAGQCTPAELSGATFAFIDLGVHGIDSGAIAASLPECASLSVGQVKKRPAYVGDRMVGQETISLSLAFDPRLVHNGLAILFMQRLRQLVERPYLLLV